MATSSAVTFDLLQFQMLAFVIFPQLVLVVEFAVVVRHLIAHILEENQLILDLTTAGTQAGNGLRRPVDLRLKFGEFCHFWQELVHAGHVPAKPRSHVGDHDVHLLEQIEKNKSETRVATFLKTQIHSLLLTLDIQISVTDTEEMVKYQVFWGNWWWENTDFLRLCSIPTLSHPSLNLPTYPGFQFSRKSCNSVWNYLLDCHSQDLAESVTILKNQNHLDQGCHLCYLWPTLMTEMGFFPSENKQSKFKQHMHISIIMK